ncbi:hypothetical protein ACLOJK_034360 [Asimina triloba]
MDFKKRLAVAISLLRIYYCQMSAHLWPPVIELRAASVTQAPSPMARKQNSFTIERPELPSRILPPIILESSGASFPGVVSPPLWGFSRGRRPEKSACCPPNQSSPAAALPSLSPLSHPSVSGSHLPPRPAHLIPRSPVPPSPAPASLPLPPVSLPTLTSSSARVLDSQLRLCYPVSRPALCPLLADCLLSRQRVSRISLSKIVCMRTKKESGLTYRMWERADMMGDEWTSWVQSRCHIPHIPHDKSHDCGFFRWVDGGSISKSGDEVCSRTQSYRGMEKIVELESNFGDLVGCVSDLKDFQLAESTRLKLTSQAELRQLKEKVCHLEEAVHRLEEGERKREMKMDLLNRN